MSDIVRTSFYYDPVRQGYDTNSWRTLSGAPAIAAGRIVADNQTGLPGSAIHYADFLKGDVSLNVNVPSSPETGGYRLFGVAAPGTGAYLRFALGPTLTCQASDGTNTTTSSAITWNSDWSGANIVYRISWEAGNARFFINGSQVAIISDSSVPYGPMSLYFYDNSDTPMTIGNMAVRGTQSFVMSPKTSDTSDTTTTGTLNAFQNVTVTDVPTILIPSLVPLSFESVVVSEAVTIVVPQLPDVLSELVTVSENVVLLIPTLFTSPNESITVTAIVPANGIMIG